MTREEILEKSQIEHRGKDIAEIEVSKNAFRAGWIVVIVLSAIVSVVDGIVFGRPAFELLFAECVSLAIVFFYKYAKLRKRHELIVAILYALGAAGFFAGWILQLANWL